MLFIGRRGLWLTQFSLDCGPEKLDLVVASEKATVISLLLAEKLKRNHSGFGHHFAPFFVILRPLQPQPRPRLLQALAYRQD
jgi:hypothetical protein